MSEESTSNGSMGEKATVDESIDRHTGSLLANPLLRYWLPPALWMSAIFILSAQPTLPHYPDRLFDVILKKMGHAVEYGILAFLLWRALSRGPGTSSRSALVSAFIVSVLYAASDEYHQTFVPGRNGNLVDVGFDAVGALVALLVLESLGRKRGRE